MDPSMAKDISIILSLVIAIFTLGVYIGRDRVMLRMNGIDMAMGNLKERGEARHSDLERLVEVKFDNITKRLDTIETNTREFQRRRAEDRKSV